jgi:hypothetical protein
MPPPLPLSKIQGGSGGGVSLPRRTAAASPTRPSDGLDDTVPVTPRGYNAAISLVENKTKVRRAERAVWRVRVC